VRSPDRGDGADLSELGRCAAAGEPVVIERLYDSDPALWVEGGFLRRFGDMAVETEYEYTTRAFLRDGDRARRSTSLADFLAASDDAGGRRVVVEQPVPDVLARALARPDLESLGGAVPADQRRLLFFGRAGGYAHLHYDYDGRAVLLTQAVGAKRVVLVPPSADHLVPGLDDDPTHWSAIYLESLAPAEQHTFLDLCGAYATVLQPGETLYIPAAWWHFVDYLSDGGGFNLRLGRPRALQQLFRICDVLPPQCRPYWRQAALALPLGSAAAADPATVARIDECHTVLRRVRRRDPDSQAAFLAQAEGLLRSFPAPAAPFVRQGDPIDPFASLRLRAAS
jgi:hypothetical protein